MSENHVAHDSPGGVLGDTFQRVPITLVLRVALLVKMFMLVRAALMELLTNG